MIKIAHFSDTHIGYEAYEATNKDGFNQRGKDFEEAFISVVNDIIANDPDLVIHAGDVADKTVLPVRQIIFIREQLEKLASIRKDGSRRQVVVISGNHEIPRNKNEKCYLELFNGIPGVHISTTQYNIVKFSSKNEFHNTPKNLTNLVIHCLPHEALKFVNQEDVLPLKNKKNILVSHGVAGGTDLFKRSIGREYPISSNLLSRNWDYVALGHWHKQGPVSLNNLASFKSLPKEEQQKLLKNSARDDNGFTMGEEYLLDEPQVDGKIWYSGSTENSGFGDLFDNGTKRGWLLVSLPKFTDVRIKRKFIPIRVMFKLDEIDAISLNPEELTTKLIDNLKNANIFGAVISQSVTNVSGETWSLVDIAKVRRFANQSLHYELKISYSNSSPTFSPINSINMKDLIKTVIDRDNSFSNPSKLVKTIEEVISKVDKSDSVKFSNNEVEAINEN